MAHESTTTTPDSLGCSLGPGPSCQAPDTPETAGEFRELPHGQDVAGHEHGHAHGLVGAHTHFREADRRGLTIVLALTAGFMIAEVAGGIVSGSLALLADAGHMLTDVAAIGFSLLALAFARRPATSEKTFGYLRLEILAALLNGALLFIIAGLIFFEAVHRFEEPHPVRGGIMLVVAAAGVAVNILAALLLYRSAGHSLNMRGAYLHVLGDLLGSLGAVAAAIIIMLTGWLPADPIISVGVALLILVSAWKLIRESTNVLLESVPGHIDLAAVRAALNDIPGVSDVHDLHIWTLTSGFLAMSGHAVVADEDHQAVLDDIVRCMRERFGIQHVTFQLERRAMYVRDPETTSV